MDVAKQIAYWRDGAAEDIRAARILVDKRCERHGLFFAHLAIEKLLKAHIVRSVGGVPPKIHVLPRLAELAGLRIPQEHQSFIRRFDRYQAMGRYPDASAPRIPQRRARELLEETEEVYEWLTALFSE
jgi:HEPN domain-containing protein